MAYFFSMLIGCCTVFLVAHQPISPAIGAVTLLLLLAGYTVGFIPWKGQAGLYLETILLSLTTFFLMVPAVSETLRRVPDRHPIGTDPQSPLLSGILGCIAITLVVGVTAQVFYIRKRSWAVAR